MKKASPRLLFVSLLGLLIGCTHVPVAPPQRAYSSVLATFDATIEQVIYDPRLLQGSEWKQFRTSFGKRAEDARTDAEFRQAFEVALSEAKLFSHFELWVSDDTKVVEGNTRPILLDKIGNGLGLIRVESFNGSSIFSDLDAALDEAINAELNTLIIDLRGNEGGTFAAWPLLDRLTDREMRIGQLVARPWYASNGSDPTLEQLASADPLTRPDGEALAADLMDDGLLVLGVVPRAPIFSGRIFVLTDSETASTSEIVSAALQANQIATVVGERTAGEVLNAQPLPLADGITLLVPVANFTLPDTSQLEGRGVEPDFAASSNDALDCAIGLSNGGTSC